MTKRIWGMVAAGALTATGLCAWALTPAPADACGGFFCNGGGSGPTPVVQAAERVIFEQRADGTVRAYVQIRYDQQGGPPVGFSWIIPVTAVPEVGIAEAATFDELDAATSPQFRFVSNAMPVSGGGGGVGCGASDSASARGSAGGDDGTMDVDGVMVWESSRIGDYETATISGERSEDLLEWLAVNGYDIPEETGGIIDEYVTEGHLFVAFKYDPIGPGTGTLAPVVLTYRGEKPCVPIRITAVASTPVLDVMVLAFGEQRARPEGAYLLTEPDYGAVRPDFSAPTGTTYGTQVLQAIGDAGGRAFVTEHASPTGELGGITDLEAQALVERNAYVTRFYTRMTPEAMTVDPEFVFPGGEDVNRLHVVDITPATSSRTGAATSPLRYALGPGVMVLAGLALLVRRRRR